ncbi:MAG TPA: hypothetical protein VJB65_03260 [Patescibacteria group bacterium]|nr:hypothetical protein [Patescibacteria group bacterium]
MNTFYKKQPPIDEQYKAKLRQALMQEHVALRQHSSKGVNIFTMIKTLRWKLTAVPIAGIVLCASWFAIQQKIAAHSTDSFLQAVRAAYAAETQQQGDVTHYKKVITHFFGEVLDSTGTQSITTQEQWQQGENSAEIVTDASGNIIERSVQLVENGKKENYQLHSPDQGVEVLPIIEKENIVSEKEWGIVEINTPPVDGLVQTTQTDIESICVLGSNFKPEGVQRKESINAVAELLDTVSREKALEQLLNNKKIVDLGEKDGVRGLKTSSGAMSFEFYFDIKTLQLKKYIESVEGRTLLIREYEVDEFIPNEQVPQEAFSIKGLKQYVMPEDPLYGKEPGCYNEKGEKISDIKVEWETGEDYVVMKSTGSDGQEMVIATGSNADSIPEEFKQLRLEDAQLKEKMEENNK